MKKIWKENAKLILAIFVTVVIASGATYAATTMYDSNTIGYDNTTSGLRSTNVQSALDELYGNVAEVILNIKSIIGNSTLTTTDQTLTGAVNELDSQITNYVTTVNVDMGNTGSVAAWSDKVMTKPLSDILPSGYRVLLVSPNYSGDDQFVFVTTAIINGNISVTIRNASSAADSGNVFVNLLCVKS